MNAILTLTLTLTYPLNVQTVYLIVSTVLLLMALDFEHLQLLTKTDLVYVLMYFPIVLFQLFALIDDTLAL